MADFITDQDMNTILGLIKNVNQGEDSYYNNLGVEIRNFLHGPQGEKNREKVNFIYEQITQNNKGGGNSTKNKTRKRKKKGKRKSTRNKRGGNPLFLLAGFIAVSIYFCANDNSDSRYRRRRGHRSNTSSSASQSEYPSTKSWTPEQLAAKKAKSANRLRKERDGRAGKVTFSPSTKSAAQSRDMRRSRFKRRGWGGGYKK